jgi:hypothetical protein
MAPDMQNPGLAPRASRDLLGRLSHRSDTSLAWRTQLIASRFALPPSMAREVSRQLFGEASDELS